MDTTKEETPAAIIDAGTYEFRDANWLIVRRDGKVFVPTRDHHRIAWGALSDDLKEYSDIIDGDTDVPDFLRGAADKAEHLTQDILSWMYGPHIGLMGELADMDDELPDTHDYEEGDGVEIVKRFGDGRVMLRVRGRRYGPIRLKLAPREERHGAFAGPKGELPNVEAHLDEDGTIRVTQEGRTVGTINGVNVERPWS